MAYNLFAQQKLTEPVPAYDPSSTVEENLSVQDSPAEQNVATAKLQTQPVVQPVQQPQAVTQQPKTIASTEDLAAAMGYTSPEQEEKMRKASLMNRRILAVGDALRHIGNIANTINYAPAQKFNSPVQEEELRYQRGKLLRDKANSTYLTYQMQKAKQDAQQRQWEAQFQLNAANAASQDAYRREQARIAAEKAANQKAYQEGDLARRKKADEDKKAFNDAKLKQDRWYKGGMLGVANRRAKDQERRTTAYVNRQKGAGGSGVAPLDTPRGQITPNGKNYSNQLLQMYDYAKSKGYVKESDVAKRLRELGYGKDQSDNVKRQMVMDLLRTNQDVGDYANSRLGWAYGAGGGGIDLGLEDDEDEMDLGLE